MKHTFFELNKNGRDFVCGDLHGSFNLFAQFLQFIKFNHTKDRMFSVGDLVDRGHNSIGCLKLLDLNWFHCVKSNHEQLMEDYLTGGPSGEWWMPNGGGWWNNLTTAEKNEIIEHLLPKIQALPWMITVDMSNGKKFHVIHAEIAGNVGETITDVDLANPEKFADIVSRTSFDGHSLLWGRDIFRDLYSKSITEHGGTLHKTVLAKHGVTDFFNPELSHIFSGHTPMREPTTVLGQTNIDTMAFETEKHSWAGLTIVEPLTNTFWKSKKDGVEIVRAVVL